MPKVLVAAVPLLVSLALASGTPLITSVVPQPVVEGAMVTIFGTNFSPNPAANLVEFSAIIGGFVGSQTLPAEVVAGSLNSLTVIVPDFAFVPPDAIESPSPEGRVRVTVAGASSDFFPITFLVPGSNSLLQPLEEGIFSSNTEIETQFFILDNPWDWEAFYRGLISAQVPAPEPPAVSFSTNLVLVALLGQRPTGGYSISFVDAVLASGTLTVLVDITEPPDDALLIQAITSPYALALVPRGGVSRVVFAQALAEIELP
ncbi:MAG: protease complex subunit PrcB family protein [Deinococcus sp.]|nr:protease complex subunit PrcB family protein [Deinococcus sp.]